MPLPHLHLIHFVSPPCASAATAVAGADQATNGCVRPPAVLQGSDPPAAARIFGRRYFCSLKEVGHACLAIDRPWSECLALAGTLFPVFSLLFYVAVNLRMQPPLLCTQVSKVVPSARCLVVAPDVRVSPTAHINPVRALQVGARCCLSADLLAAPLSAPLQLFAGYRPPTSFPPLHPGPPPAAHPS